MQLRKLIDVFAIVKLLGALFDDKVRTVIE
jgi:hypothetical protein